MLKFVMFLGIAILLLPFTNIYAESITVNTNKESYGYGSIVSVSGKVQPFVEGEKGTIKVYTPKNRIFLEDTFTPSKDGSYSYSFKLEGGLLEEGSWIIKLSYNGNNKVIAFTVQESIEGEVGEPQVVLNISTDKKEYLIGETVTISGNASPVSDKFVIIRVFNPANFAISFAQVAPSGDGSFSNSFLLKGDIAIAGNYTINVTYSGKSAQMTIRVIEVPETLEETEQETSVNKITTSPIALVDFNGVTKGEISVGEQILIQAELLNNQNKQQDFTYIVQVKSIDGEIIMISWFQSTLNANQASTVAQSWMPEEKGRFTIETFVWENLSNPTPLTDTVKMTVRVN